MNRRVLSETIWYGAGKYGMVIVNLLISAVLARLLSPAEFGVVTIVTVFTAFFAVLADLGLGAAVIQHKQLSEEEISDIFSISVFFSVILAVFFALFGFPIAAFYGNQEYRKICLILSLSVLFNAMNIIPNAMLMKNKRFKLVGMRMICVTVIVGALTVAMAYFGMSYYAIVMQSVLQSCLILLWNIWSTKPRFHLRIHLDSIRTIRNYSVFQFLYSLVNYCARNLDNLLIGKLMGNESLAYYDKGYRLMMYPMQNLTYVLNPLLHPILSDYQDDRRKIYDSYMRVAQVLSVIGVYVSLVCFWNSRELILLIFGGQWERSVPLFRLLSLSVWPQMIVTSAGSVYQSTGNTRLMFISGMVHFSITIICIIVGILIGKLETVAALVALSLYLRFLIDYFCLIRLNFGYSWLAFLSAFAKDGLVMAAGVLLSRFIPEQFAGFGLVANLCFKAGVISAAFLGLLLVSGQGRMLLGLLKRAKR